MTDWTAARERLMELLLRGDTVIFIVDEAPAVFQPWRPADRRGMLAHWAAESRDPEFELHRAMVGDEVHQVPIVDDRCDGRVWNLLGPSERCTRLAGHEGECEP